MIKNIMIKRGPIIASCIAIGLACLIPLFVKSPYQMNLIILIIINAILGMAFIVTLRTGQINLGMTFFEGAGAYISSILVMKLGLTFWLSMPLSIIISGVIAFGFGYILIGSGSSGFTFVVLSSVIGMLFSVMVGNIPLTGGYNGLSNIPPPDPIRIPFLPPINFDSKAQFFFLAIFLLVVVILTLKAVYASSIGRAWTAIGLNSRLAESTGVNIFKYKMISFILSSAICALIGSFYAHFSGYLNPNGFGIWQNVYIQIYAILGGVGYAVLGPLIGSMVMVYIPEFLRITLLIAPIITGIILILLILFFPGGLLGLLQYRTVTVGIFKKSLFRLLPKAE